MNEFAEYAIEEPRRALMEYWRYNSTSPFRERRRAGCFEPIPINGSIWQPLIKSRGYGDRLKSRIARIYRQDSPQAVRLRKSYVA